MALTVEDGTGLSNADSLVSLADATSYHAALGNTSWASVSYTDDQREQALRRASQFLRDSFAWQGYPVNGREQAMAWPRTAVSDADGYSVDNDSVPQEIKDATCIAALAELVTPGTMYPEVAQSGKVKMEKIGPITVEYLNQNHSALADRPELTKLTALVGPLLSLSKTGNPIAGSTYLA